jgi:hypothetical protein
LYISLFLNGAQRKAQKKKKVLCVLSVTVVKMIIKMIPFKGIHEAAPTIP